MACVEGRLGLEYIMRWSTCSGIQMNGNDGLYLRLPKPPGPPDLTTNWLAERNKDNFLVYRPLYLQNIRCSSLRSSFTPPILMSDI